jgi:hypothetical protein
VVARYIVPGQAARVSQKCLPSEAGLSALYENYITHAQRQGVPRRQIETQLGMFLKKLIGSGLRRSRKDITTDRGNHRENVYTFPPLSEYREVFEDLLGQEIPWGSDDNWL